MQSSSVNRSSKVSATKGATRKNIEPELDILYNKLGITACRINPADADKRIEAAQEKGYQVHFATELKQLFYIAYPQGTYVFFVDPDKEPNGKGAARSQAK